MTMKFAATRDDEEICSGFSMTKEFAATRDYEEIFSESQ